MKQQTRRPFPLNGNGPIAFEQLGGRLDAETKAERLIPQDLPLASGPAFSELPSRPIAEIIVGARHRKDMGDIEGLAASIADVGLLHPIVVHPDGTLIAGERRLRACQHLGWSEVPVRIVDVDDVRRGELAENAQRKDFLPSEIDAIRRAMMSAEQAAAKARMSEGGKGGQIAQPSRAMDKVANFAGVSRHTIEKIAKIVAAAEAEPEKYGKYLEAMDRTGAVDGSYKRLTVARQAEAIRKEPPPLPGHGPHRVAVVDPPPWPFDAHKQDPSRHPAHPYPEMMVEQICAVPVGEHMTEDAILWLWTTNFHMWFVPQILESWGFTPKTILTWGKTRMSTGDWLRGQTEHCALAMRGKPLVQLVGQTTLLVAPRRGPNSRKPDEFYRLVEELCPAPRYVEFFAREARPNWDGFGNKYQGTESTGARQIAHG
jgi:ParB/RepB/Spo0J family partition protein